MHKKFTFFSFNGQFYLQKDGVRMGSPLVPIIVGIIVELEKSLILVLSSYMTSWKCYVDDTIGYVKKDTIEHVISIINSCHGKISFT